MIRPRIRTPVQVPAYEPTPIVSVDRPRWHDNALCAQTDPEAFFPEKGGSTREAKQICRMCPVISECLSWALDNDEWFGIYGGLSERERRRIKKTNLTEEAAA